MKRKGFTLVELLVVIAIIALLMGILMPALAMVRALAQRVVCGTNLSSAGKAIMLYAGEYRGKYPRAGGRDSYWGPNINHWNGVNETEAYDMSGDSDADPATIGSCLYLLIKYADAAPKAFICGGDSSSREFFIEQSDNVLNNDVADAWDFRGAPQDGDAPDVYYSYSYHAPFGQVGSTYYPLTQLSDSGMAVMADKNPYIVNVQDDPDWGRYYYRGIDGGSGSKQTEKWGNSPNHSGDGQNVLFNDFHVSFAEAPYCGLDDDNIYSMTRRGSNVSQYVEVGYEPWDITGAGIDGLYSVNIKPGGKKDSLLLNEGVISMTTQYPIVKTPE